MSTLLDVADLLIRVTPQQVGGDRPHPTIGVQNPRARPEILLTMHGHQPAEGEANRFA